MLRKEKGELIRSMNELLLNVIQDGKEHFTPARWSTIEKPALKAVM